VPSLAHSTPGDAAAAHGSPLAVLWITIAVPVGLVGVWMFLFLRQLRAWPLFPVNDPYYKEALAHDAH